jgi:hypothetical protein
MKMNSRIMIIAILAVLFGGVALTTALGLWNTENTRTPARLEKGDSAGAYNPEDIRGSYSFEDVSNLFEIPLDELRTAFGLPEDVDLSVFRTGDLESLYGEQLGENQEIGNGSVQLFVAIYNGLPYSLAEPDYLPESAAGILKTRGNLDEETLAYLDEYSLQIAALENAEAVEVAQAEAEEEHVTEGSGSEAAVNGNTTFWQILDAGVSEERITEILGMEMPNSALTVKDFCMENGLQFSAIKAALEAEITGE